MGAVCYSIVGPCGRRSFNRSQKGNGLNSVTGDEAQGTNSLVPGRAPTVQAPVNSPLVPSLFVSSDVLQVKMVAVFHQIVSRELTGRRSASLARAGATPPCRRATRLGRGLARDVP